MVWSPRQTNFLGVFRPEIGMFQMFRQIYTVYTGEWGARRRESMFPKLQEKLRSDLRAVQQTYRDRCWILGCFLVRIQSNQINRAEAETRNSIEIERSGIPINWYPTIIDITSNWYHFKIPLNHYIIGWFIFGSALCWAIPSCHGDGRTSDCWLSSWTIARWWALVFKCRRSTHLQIKSEAQLGFLGFDFTLLPTIFLCNLPSGKLTVCYWKWQFIVSFPIKNSDFL